MKSPLLPALFLCLTTFSARAAAVSDPVAAEVSPSKPDGPGQSQSRLTSAATAATPTAKKRYIVTLAPDASPETFAAQRGLRMRQQLRDSPSGFARDLASDEALVLPALNIVICDLNGDEARTARGQQCVLAVEADGPVSLCGQTNGTGVVRIGMEQFPISRINGITEPLDVDVAVIDSGIDPHPDLTNVVQWFSSFSNNGNDELSHGTGVAGFIGATDNDFGVVGVAPGVRIWNIKAIGPPPNNEWSRILSGMNYVYQNANQISVANMSIVNAGLGGPIVAVHNTLRLMADAGIVVVAAAGNSTNDLAGADGIYGTGDDFFPAALPGAMAVSAMDSTNDTFWIGSNFSQIERTNGYQIGTGNTFGTNFVFSPGGAIDVAAPGVNILSTFTNGGYTTRTGTSRAAPHVAGLVALYIAANGRATNAAGVYAIRQAIVNASLPQSLWNTNNTYDPDTNPEPLAIASEAWIPQPRITSHTGAPGNFQLGFTTVPGYDYALQSATHLTPPVTWTNLATVTDTNELAENYYRLERSPAP